jgi:hypothetical protein
VAKEPRVRLVRCPHCRIQFETEAARPECSVCQKPVSEENMVQSFDDEPSQKTPTRSRRR